MNASNNEESQLVRFFNDDLIFNDIASYLSISEILRLSQLSKHLKSIIERRCLGILKANNLQLIPSKTAIHQMRFYFDRCLTISRRDEKGDTKETVNVSKPFKFNIIKFWEVGVIYSAFLNNHSEAYIFRTSDLLIYDRDSEQLQFQKRSNVKVIKAKGEVLIYLKTDGTVWNCIGQKKGINFIDKEEQLQWSSTIPIQRIEASFNYSLYFPKSDGVSFERFMKEVNGYDIDLKGEEFESEQHLATDQQKGKSIIVRNNLTLKYFQIQYKQLKIIETAVGAKQAYFITDQYQCFRVNLEDYGGLNANHEGPVKSIELFGPLEGKSIIKIASGYNFFVALERKIEKVENWSVEEVCKWVRDIGFSQFSRIFKAQKVDGFKLLEIDKNYMYSNLGITKPNMQQKFFMCLEDLVQAKDKVDNVYGWGKNETGQLGSSHSNYVKDPQKIKVGVLKENEFIDSIFCGWFETFIRSQKGRVYKTILSKERKKNSTPNNIDHEGLQHLQKEEKKDFKDKRIISKKNVVDYDEFYDDIDNNYRLNSKKEKAKLEQKKKRKNTQDFNGSVKEEKKRSKDFTRKKFEEEGKWTQCAEGKAFLVGPFKQVSFFIQCPSQKQFEPEKEKKLRTAKMILNKIIWSSSLQSQEDYKVGYMDKDMGLIEATIYELKKFEFIENRIKYIKRKGVIAWDRQNKIDHI